MAQTLIGGKKCGSGANVYAYVSDIDIIISNDSWANWFFSNSKHDALPQGKDDFYQTILHELGHGHALNHVNQKKDFMYRQADPGMFGGTPGYKRNIYFTPPSITGLNAIMDKSLNANLSSCSSHNENIVGLSWSPCVINYSSISEVKDSLEMILVYPNPFRNSITVSNLELKESYRIELYDMLGNRIQPLYNNRTNSSDLTFIIDDSLPNGIYLCRIQNSKQEFLQKMLVKNR